MKPPRSTTGRKPPPQVHLKVVGVLPGPLDQKLLSRMVILIMTVVTILQECGDFVCTSRNRSHACFVKWMRNGPLDRLLPCLMIDY